MRIRWKLLITLLSISLIPIFVLRINGQRSMENMGNELASITRETLIQKAGLELTVLVEEHASVLRLERELIEMVLRVQAAELEKRLAGAHHAYSFRNGANGTQASQNNSLIQNPPLRYYLTGMGRFRPLVVDYNRSSQIIFEDDHLEKEEISAILSSMVPVFQDLVIAHPDLIFWQLAVIDGSAQSVYPAVPNIPKSYNALHTQWYRSAVEEKRLVWSRPSPDPFTGQFSFTVSMPIYSAGGSIIGATAISVPVSALLQEDRHFKLFSENFSLLLVRAETTAESEPPDIRVVAKEYTIEQRHRHWLALSDVESLPFSDPQMGAKMAKDLQVGRTGVLETKYEGIDSLMVYGKIDEFGTTLLLVVPKADFVAEAAAMEKTVHERVNANIKFTGFILVGIIFLVVALAFILAKSMTMNIQKLVSAARRVAQGDFSTRAEIQTRDEMGELGRTFDLMVPALEERVQIKQTLDVAMEIQQNFLPRKVPHYKGLDIAGRSIYCDETGGDFFDFMDFCCREKDLLGVSVGDVSGHGISAALLMSTVRALLRSRVNQPGDICSIIDDVNQMLSKDLDGRGEFVTLFYAEIDRARSEIRWVRAGHDPALLYEPHGDRFEELQGAGLSIGIDPSFRYPQNVKHGLSEGQIITISTDGIWETRNALGEMFGKQRLKNLIRSNSRLSADGILNSITEALEEYRAEAKQTDDVTLVVIKIIGAD